MKIQRVSSKWTKTKVILKNRSLSNYIPHTRKYGLDILKEMLNTYNTVYIKPDRGTYGNGVMRAEQRIVTLSPSVQADPLDNNEPNVSETKTMYILRYNKSAEVFSSPEELDETLKRLIKGREYLIQKGINLLCYQERPFDLRVLTQKAPSGLWETTGMLGRVAAPHKIITNYHSGGRIQSVKELLCNHMSDSEAAHTMVQLKMLGIQMAQQLETIYPRIKEIGLDVAIDNHHNLWLLEINTLPSLVVFKLFPDPSIYRRIYRYAAAYGRFTRGKKNLSLRRKGKSKLSK